MSKKKRFEYMSQNEWLGDATTHFMKSGTAIRSPANKDQESLAKYVPREANGVKVEYDITFEIPGAIHGYKFSDFLTKALYIAPQNTRFATDQICQAASLGATDEGKRIFALLHDSIEDKYILDDDDDFECDEIVVLPGTNLLSKENIVDFDKIDRLVAAGAHVKVHPITEKTWVQYLKNRWGRKLIPADAPLYPIMRNASKVYFTMSSETGIAATIMGKKLGIVDHPQKSASSTFQHIYKGLDQCKVGSLKDKMIALLSHPESGVLTTYHVDHAERVGRYFDHMAQFKHK